jgi:hypothetical protein
MAGVKITAFVDAAAQAATAEREADRAAVLALVADELIKLHEIIDGLVTRVDKLEAMRPTFSG